jgi:hypothetical protein
LIEAERILATGWLLMFLAWCGFGALAGPLLAVSSSPRVQALLGLVVAILGTTVSLLPMTKLWIVALIVVLASAVAFRDHARKRAVRVVRVLVETLYGVRTYREERLERMLRSLALEHKRTYKVIHDTINIRIDPSGNSETTRQLEVAAEKDSVSWIDLGYSVTVPNPRGAGVIIETPDVLDGDGRPLDYELYEDTDATKRLMVLLRELLQPGGPSQTIRLDRHVRGAWRDLVKLLADHGTYHARNQVKRVTVTISVPRPLVIDKFEVDPSVGTREIAADRVSASWSAEDVVCGQTYRYSVVCLKRE